MERFQAVSMYAGQFPRTGRSPYGGRCSTDNRGWLHLVESRVRGRKRPDESGLQDHGDSVGKYVLDLSYSDGGREHRSSDWWIRHLSLTVPQSRRAPSCRASFDGVGEALGLVVVRRDLEGVVLEHLDARARSRKGGCEVGWAWDVLASGDRDQITS